MQKKELKKLTLKRKQEDAVANEGGPGSAKQKKAIIQVWTLVAIELNLFLWLVQHFHTTGSFEFGSRLF